MYLENCILIIYLDLKFERTTNHKTSEVIILSDRDIMKVNHKKRRTKPYKKMPMTLIQRYV